MSKFVLLLACVTLFQTATALKCYYCLAGPQCDVKEEELQKTDCKPATGLDPVCTFIRYKEKSSGKEVIRRGCEATDKGKKYECKINEAESVTQCVSCTEDLCNLNSAYGFRSSGFVAVVGLVAVYLVPKILM